MRTIVIDLAPYYDSPDVWVSVNNFNRSKAADNARWIELRMHAEYVRHACRFSVLFTGPDGATRLEHGGPMVPGMHGSLIAQASVISAHPYAQAEVIDVEEGDVLLLNGHRMVIADDRPRTEYPRLIPEPAKQPANS